MRRALVVALVLATLPSDGIARSAGGTPVALVATAHGARLAMVDVWTGELRAMIRLPDAGRAVASTFDARRVLVATSRGVTLADMRRKRVLARFRLADPVDVEISPSGRRGFVLERGRGTLAVLDLVRRRVAGRVAVGHGAHTLAVSDHRAWVANASGDPALAVVDMRPGESPVVTARLPAGGPVRALLHLPDSAWLLVTYRDSADVAKLDAGIRARIVFRRGVGGRPAAIGIHPLTTDLWVAVRTRLALLSSRTGAPRGTVAASAPVIRLEGFGSYMAAVTARDIRIFGSGGRRFAITPVAGGVADVALAVVD